MFKGSDDCKPLLHRANLGLSKNLQDSNKPSHNTAVGQRAHPQDVLFAAGMHASVRGPES